MEAKNCDLNHNPSMTFQTCTHTYLQKLNNINLHLLFWPCGREGGQFLELDQTPSTTIYCVFFKKNTYDPKVIYCFGIVFFYPGTPRVLPPGKA